MAKKPAQLEEYRRKRDFARTSEPSGDGAGAAGKRDSGLTFIVQKHDATRLHYDFRLELDGVLLSWAVTKGPSLNPADKRLAVHVEDHPLDYATFEGTIPKGEYGGGTVMLWDRGTWEPEGDPHRMLEKGDLKFTLHGKRLKGSWVLVHMKGRDTERRNGPPRENWLLIKHRDDHARDDVDVTEKFRLSVETGRDLDAIAKGLKPRRKPSRDVDIPDRNVWTSKGAVAGDPDARPRRSKSVKHKVASSAPAKPAKPRPEVQFDREQSVAAAAALGVKLSSPDRVVYEGPGITKADLVAYYATVSETMLKFVADRPLSLVRAPAGAKGHQFFQKHDTGGFPGGFRKVVIHGTDADDDRYLYVDDASGLIGGVQMNVLEWHIWGSRRDLVEKAERIIFDIDPDEGLGFEHVKRAAVDIRDILGALGLDAFPMATGGKGIHVICPIGRRLEWPDIKAFCRGFSKTLERNEPDRFVAELSKAKRKGRMFVDYLRNERGQTAVAPYSTRARAGCPVAVPISWEELDGLDRANGFTIETAAARAIDPAHDPWPGYFDSKPPITKAMLRAVGAED